MEEIIKLDLLGFYCPIPVHELRKAINSSDKEVIFELVCDDPETLHDIPALCQRMGVELESVSEKSGEYSFRIIKTFP
ncbi:MAG: sulfurtransferase TusA family protein [Candidatus Thalassarchaeaceae archaeon]